MSGCGPGGPRLLLVGAGSVGRRYLQGLDLVSVPLDVHVVDIEPRNLDIVLEDWSGGTRSTRHGLQCHEGFDGCPEEVDLGIVATTAEARLGVLSDASKSLRSSYWILEKVLAQSPADLLRMSAALADCEAVWVNTWARCTTWYRRIREAAGGGGPWSLEATGTSWGLGCNSIHLLDLFAWWTCERLVSVDASDLGERWWPAKRPGFEEPSGRLRARFDGGSTMTMEADAPHRNRSGWEAAGRGDLDHLSIEGPSGRWVIEGLWSEAGGCARGPRGEEIRGRIDYQSERTAGLVEGILEEGCCCLTPFTESVRLHSLLLDALIAHRGAVTGEDVDRVPIT